ncbi:MAG: molybdate ABC transporter substrate-binding protein [Ardenticatenia bacterium]|nr:molybdate ABC transporter substrate-binding protein [Ardenticatenia bacterium]
MRLRRLLPVLVGVLSLAVASTACADQPAPAADGAAETVELQVFAAASLTVAFQEIGDTFAVDHPEAVLAFNFAGSQQLASQIKEGAQADVFASANQRQMDGVVAAGDVISGTQRAFARNRLVVVMPPDNPAELRGLADLGRPDVKVVLAAKAVPAGSYALAFLGKASAHPGFTPAYSATVMANVVSFEDDVVGVLGKVAQGEADAGIVYLSDVSGPADPKVLPIDIPEALNVIATYPIAPLANAQHPDLAQAFVDRVLSAPGPGRPGEAWVHEGRRRRGRSRAGPRDGLRPRRDAAAMAAVAAVRSYRCPTVMVRSTAC